MNLIIIEMSMGLSGAEMDEIREELRRTPVASRIRLHTRNRCLETLDGGEQTWANIITDVASTVRLQKELSKIEDILHRRFDVVSVVEADGINATGR